MTALAIDPCGLSDFAFPAWRSGRQGVPVRGAGRVGRAAASVADDDTMSDEALVARLRVGDRGAGEALARRYHDPLIRYLQRLAGEAAEELYQQTWLSVLDRLDGFDAAAPGGGFKPWLFRIATNKANDRWRSRGRERAAKEGLKHISCDEFRPPDHRMESTEQEAKLRVALEQLPQSQREVLTLRYYGSFKFVEIAELVGCPLNTALGRAHKGILKLRQLMGAE